jgi:hypothetical protein
MLRAEIASRPSGPFDEEAERRIQELRQALGRVIDSLPGQRIVRPSELANALSLDTMLAWKIWKVINDADPFEAARYMPGASGVRQFLRAAKKQDAVEEAVQAAQQAYDAFQSLIRTHAGDRKSFDMMLAGHVTKDRARADFEHRRGAFQHLSYIWGVQAKTQIYTYLVRPSETPGFCDAAAVRGFIDLRRIRPDVPWRITRCFTVDDAGKLRTSFDREPLDPAPRDGDELSDLPLLRDFCSRPLPQCRRVNGPDGQVVYQLVEGSVGNAGLLTCLMGEVVRATEPRFRDEAHQNFALQAAARTPCELLQFDVLMDRRMFDHYEPTLQIYSALFLGELNAKPMECDRLPAQETVEHLGFGLGVIRAAEVPRYDELIASVFQRLGWNPDDFGVYRLRMEYPPIPAILHITQKLPEGPEGSAGRAGK